MTNKYYILKCFVEGLKDALKLETCVCFFNFLLREAIYYGSSAEFKRAFEK